MLGEQIPRGVLLLRKASSCPLHLDSSPVKTISLCLYSNSTPRQRLIELVKPCACFTCKTWKRPKIHLHICLIICSQDDLMEGVFFYTVEVIVDRKMPAVQHHNTTLWVHNAFIKYNPHYTLEHTCWHFLKTAACSCMWVPHLLPCVFVSWLLHDSYKGSEALNFLLFAIWNPNVKFLVFITAFIFRVFFQVSSSLCFLPLFPSLEIASCVWPVSCYWPLKLSPSSASI